MGEVRFVPGQPMVVVGGCNFCRDRFPGHIVHIIEKVGFDGASGLQIRMCDLCVQSLERQRSEWARRKQSGKNPYKKKRKTLNLDEFGDVKLRKTA